MFQTSLFDSELQNNPSNSLALIKEHFPISDLIPASWVYKFYKHFGRKRDFSLSSFILAFILQRAFTIPTTELLITLLGISSELREFCGFNKVPGKSKFSRFKTSFHNELEEFFHSMVDLTEPICRAIDAEASKTLIIDTTGIEVYVAENNPKFFASIQKRIEGYYKSRNQEVEPAKVIMQAACQMPKKASSNTDASYQYTNGHFAYALKGALICNKLGLVRHMKFCDTFTSLSDDLVEEKYLYDSKIFAPTLRDNSIIPRDSKQWDDIAGSRYVVEQVISRLKLPLALSNSYTRNSKTVKFDFFMADIVQLIIAYVAFKAGLIDKIQCVKSFAA